MPLKLDAGCQAAIDLAKRGLIDGAPLGADLLLSALYHADAELKRLYPSLEPHIPSITPRREEVPARVTLAENVQPVFQSFADTGRLVTARELFTALATSPAGHDALRSLGLDDAALDALDEAAGDAMPPPDDPGAGDWRGSDARRSAMAALDSYGRMLTASELPQSGVVERDDTLRALVRTLSKMRRRNAIVIGPAGSGKSAIIYELSRRMVRRDAALPPRLRDMDIFELSPTFLRSGASVVGQYEERVKGLLKVLEDHPKIILFVDEIHSMFQSGVHDRGPFTDANEAFKAALGRGAITVLGCTTTGEYRRYIEPDRALERRFGVIRIEAPSAEATRRILRARRGRMEEYYAPLRIPDEVLDRAVALTEDYLVSRSQPDKSIQLLDEACAHSATTDPPAAEVSEAALMQALEDMIGHSVVRPGQLTESGVLAELERKIVGQDAALRQIANAFVAGFGGWTRRSAPRGVFLFGGPTGVGKTETALLLAGILGDASRTLIRIDCNTLQGTGHDASPAIARLLGAPPGYVGYARGQGGLLSRIRDYPESIVLFDEFEKAVSGVGKLLLQIIDDGRLEDVDGNVLDFRRAFIIFTTNAGCHYDAKQLGFAEAPDGGGPTADADSVRQGLRDIGLGEEFLARITHTIIFQGLDRDAIRVIFGRLLESLRRKSEARGLGLSWSNDFVDHLTRAWQPRFGVRFATAILSTRIGEQLDLADAQGELAGVARIVLEVRPAADGSKEAHSGHAVRRREGDALVIRLE